MASPRHGDAMPEFVDWGNAQDAAALVDQAVAVLRRGEWVAAPTECGYAAVALASQAAVEKLPAVDCTWSLVLNDVIGWLARLEPLAQRLLRRCWPGPILFEIEGADREPPTVGLSPLVWSQVSTDHALAVRLPGHDAVLALLESAGEPLVLVEPNGDAGPRWVEALGEALTLVLESGPPAFALPPTRVRIGAGRWSVRRDGVYTADELQQRAACMLVFLCTGNTCRSPMSEALCKKLLAERLGCGIEELIARGWWVLSAGVAAARGEPATPEAQVAVQGLGVDLSQHLSRPLTPELIELADHVIVMTGQQAALVRELFPNVEPWLLGGDADVPDPFGASQQEYNDCAGVIVQHLQRMLAEVLPP